MFICCHVYKYHSGDKTKKTEVGRACSTYGERRGAYRVLVRKPEGRRPLGRQRSRWEDIKMDLREVGWGSMDWIDLVYDGQVEGSCEYGNGCLGSIKCGEFLD
jgi:hypothetical protein